MKLSIVSTLYGSASFVEDFIDRVRRAALSFGESYEIVLVNDGSPDQSLEIALALAETSDDLVIVDLSRNFGHHHALLSGLSYARGDIIFLIDSDLEEDPAWLEPLHKKMLEDQADMVCAVQSKRKGGLLEKVSGKLFYRLFSIFSKVDIPQNAMTARLFTRQLADALSQYNERIIFLPGLFALTGFKQTTLPLTKAHKGSTTYSLRRRISLAADGISAFSSAPLRYIFYTGTLISVLATLLSGAMVLNWLFFSVPPSGWTSVFISIWLLGGFTLLSLGVLGLYVARIFEEVKARPNVIVKSVHDFTRRDDSDQA